MIRRWHSAVSNARWGHFAIGLGLFAGALAGVWWLEPSYAPVPSMTRVPGQDAAPRESKEARWAAELKRMDDALGEKNVSAAEQAWHDAHVEALASLSWEPMVDVGDAALRIAWSAGSREAYEPKARRVYLSAFFRARREGSMEGVLRAAQAFAALGDMDVVRQCLRTAERLATRASDHQALARIRELQEQLESPVLNARTVKFNEAE